ncbi:50S ribosomal protein L13 [Candidatus Giovannonibacteria bacterium RIFCSPLOWO2_01_FULL_46_13]|uniref:50S ribosomal protein L13 n=1 Tax=Candidatus Giovannonibacteria bacterium RIFCSPLOWO2_01_FULL_46_13 TaxID=1798352 RepID=A0A1F5X3Q3_9BACT|nr:MAG: 50S ribosomal protein L13 [Candidatus Giovannonibacteria bacterium RIFCSPLOWO2_01_FULL_46_13]
MENKVLDVKGKSLGRAASEASVLLRGKNLPSFEPRIRPKHTITVKNLKAMEIHPTKFRTKVYTNYSGYPGGLKEIGLRELWAKNPKEVFKRAVWGMLPKNRSRKEIIKNLKFE